MALAEQPTIGKNTGKNAFMRFLTNKVTLALIISLVLILGSGVTALAVYTHDNGLFMPGVTVTGIDVGNMTQAMAQAKIDSKIESVRSRVVKFDLEGKTLESSLGDLGLTLSGNEALNQAYAIGHVGTLIERAEQKRAALQGVNFELSSAWDKKKLSVGLTKMLKPYQVPAHDASFTITPANTMNISKETAGKGMDVAVLAAQVQKLDIYQPGNELKVSPQEVPPKLTAATLEKEKITGLLAGYTTNFDPSQALRTENVRLAANALDGAVIAPGETFSFNKRVGERTDAKGYQDAYIIVNGQFVEGLGGGICQVSSTLYNTVLLADLPITQRTNHDLAISYVPLGQDATVAWPTLDLKFRNDSGTYILIRTIMGKNSLIINFYGQPQPDRQVVIANSPAPVTSKGYKVTSTRTILLKGKVVKTEALGSSFYVPKA
jgi:vancomycin resistance protein YoaR